MKSLELQYTPPTEQAVAIRNEPMLPAVDINLLLTKAIDAKSAVEVIERLQVLHRELKADKAKEAFDAAMSAFQAECPIIQKRKAGAKNAYKYAPLDDIVFQTRDLIRKHGFSFSISSEIEPGWVKAVCIITHKFGHSSRSEFKVPIDNKNPMMTDPQRYGGAMTFSKRYCFVNAFGILTADEDLDGASSPKPAGPSSKLAADDALKTAKRGLWQVLETVRGDKRDWTQATQWMVANGILKAGEEINKLSAERLDEAAIKSRIALGL